MSSLERQTQLHFLCDSSRYRKCRQRLGRGVGSHRGKTSCRGAKGAGSRSGWGSRATYEGGQFRFFMKLPIRGFSNARFARRYHTVNLIDLERAFEDGERVTIETLIEKGFFSGKTYGVKLLGKGALTKKLEIEVDAISETARQKLVEARIPFTVLSESEPASETI